MPGWYKFKDQDKLYFVSFAVVHWIDLFVRNEYKDILLKSWQYCIEQKGMELYAWCIMTSHVHMIIGSHGESLGGIAGYETAHLREVTTGYSTASGRKQAGMDVENDERSRTGQ